MTSTLYSVWVLIPMDDDIQGCMPISHWVQVTTWSGEFLAIRPPFRTPAVVRAMETEGPVKDIYKWGPDDTNWVVL